MLRVGQRVAVGNIKVIVVDIVQKHVDPAEVIDREVDFLPKESYSYIFLAENLGKLQKKRTGTASRIIYLVDFFFV